MNKARFTLPALVALFAFSTLQLFAADQVWTGVRIIDGTGPAPMENASLLIRDGRIVAVGTKAKAPAGAEKIDGYGKTIIPGLINAHGHVNDPAQLGVYLRYGITTVLSLGGLKEFELRDQVRSAPANTIPHLYVAGPIQDSSVVPGSSIAVTSPE